jgi:hypothetical protein
VAAACTSSEEIVLAGETGFVAHGNARAVAKAIARLTVEETRQRKGIRAAELAWGFECAESAWQVAEIYGRVARARVAGHMREVRRTSGQATENEELRRQ